MEHKRLSKIMSDANHAVGDAQDKLNETIIEAINTHFDAGIHTEQERIIKLLEELIQEPSTDLTYIVGRNDALCQAIALIKGEK